VASRGGLAPSWTARSGRRAGLTTARAAAATARTLSCGKEAPKSSSRNQWCDGLRGPRRAVIRRAAMRPSASRRSVPLRHPLPRPPLPGMGTPWHIGSSSGAPGTSVKRRSAP
jgi:hypothetical protein